MRAARSSRRRGRGGFTLLELVLVLLIVGVLAVFALPALTSAPGLTVSAMAAELAANIRYTQSLAMSRGQRYRINFTPTSFQITDMGGGGIVQPLTGNTAAVSVSPATLAGYNPPLTSNYVAFDTRGTPYVDATTPLAGAVSIAVSVGAESASVVVAPETGRVQ